VVETLTHELANGFDDVLGVAHTLGEDNEAPRRDLDEVLILVVWVHFHLPLHQVPHLLGRVGGGGTLGVW
jgi:hypothetical protein